MQYKKSRIFIVLSGLFIVWVGLVARSVYIQVIPNEKLLGLKERQFSKVVTLQPRRGVILDRNGKELAASISTHSVFADPTIVKNKAVVSEKVASILNMRPSELKILLRQRDKKFVWIKRNISAVEKQEIEDLKIRGISFIQESKRIYPNNQLMAPVLGFVGKEGQGLAGIEARFNDQLTGVQKKMQVQRDARGRPLVVDGQLFTEQPDGATFQLTIDLETQYFLEQVLKQSIEEHNAKGAVGIVLDAKTSEVLGMASLPSFDANRPSEYPMDNKRNRAVTDPFEPGSTLKTFLVAAGLKEGILNANTKYFCENGQMKIGKRIIREADSKHKFGNLTVSEILAKSSNVGSAKIGFDLGQERYLKVLREFGFGEKSGLPMGGESRGIIPTSPWKDITLATVAFGQGMAATPIQMAAAYAVIANGGEYKRPKIIKSIQDPETGEGLEVPSQEVRRVLTRDQANLMMFMLTSVTQVEGTATAARVNGFPVAGKTGTAQKIDPVNGGYMKGAYISSFAGIIPAQDPQFVIYVAVDQPEKKYYGSEVAAPIFAQIASYLVRKSGMSPVLLSEKNVMNSAPPKVFKSNEEETLQEIKDGEGYKIPQLTGLSLREVIQKVQGAPIDFKIYGQGAVYEMSPGPGSIISSGETLRIYLK